MVRDRLVASDLLPENGDEMDFKPHVIDYLKNNLTFTNELNNRFKTFFENKRNQTYYCGESLKPLLNEKYLDRVKINDKKSTC